MIMAMEETKWHTYPTRKHEKDNDVYNSGRWPTCNHRVILDGASYNHDSIMQWAFSLLYELLRSTPHDDGTCACLRAAREQVEPTSEREV